LQFEMAANDQLLTYIVVIPDLIRDPSALSVWAVQGRMDPGSSPGDEDMGAASHSKAAPCPHPKRRSGAKLSLRAASTMVPVETIAPPPVPKSRGSQKAAGRVKFE
jgi:hypothetical protein